MKHILILGGDGYLGWPTAMRFSVKGYKVTVVDNYMRRNACLELNTNPLFEVPNLIERARVWNEKTGLEINVIICDLANPALMRSLFDGGKDIQYGYGKSATDKFDVVVHYAEQPSAPYSILDSSHADITLVNNLRVTNNLIWAVKDFSPDTHIIKLGTMGEYGTPNIDIEEGWINIKHNGREGKFLYPRQASSLYHTTKIMDTDLLWFAVRTWGLRVTDLMQGPVYGMSTDETDLDAKFRTIFNYDEIFGTVINRFIVQAVIGYPLTVYGAGGQTRGYINIKDTIRCIEVAADNSPDRGDLKIYNQITETFKVNELAELICKVARDRGLAAQIKAQPNPRKEAEDHYYNPKYSGLKDLGLEPNLLTEQSLHGIFELVESFKDKINSDIIFKGIKW
jgi:UDP-sulfoquinovose synthase